MRPQAVLTVIKKELGQYFNNPTAYIILTVFLVLWEFLFFRNVFLVGEASLRLLLSYTPWLFIVLIPALTMGSISSEKSEGTLEFLLTNPLNAIELIVGKFLATVIFLSIGLAFMFPLALSLDQFTAPNAGIDWGVVVGQFGASILLAAVFSALGIMISSFFANQIAALLVGATASFFMVIIGFELITLTLPSPFAAVAERLSILARFESMSRGVIDLRDLWYFFSAVVIFLSLAFLQIIRLRLGNKKRVYQQYITGIGLFIGIAVLLNVVGNRIPGRLDLTENQSYKLSQVTKETIQNVDDVINIKLYASTELPDQLRPVLRDTKDILRDYRLFGDGNIQLTVKDPSKDPDVAAEAINNGIQEVQFNVIDQDELQLSKGYLGLSIEYGGEIESMPLIANTTDLEYQLTGLIRKLTIEDKKQIAFLTGHGEKARFDYPQFVIELEKTYDVTELSLGADEDSDSIIPETLEALIIAGPTVKMEEETLEKIVEYHEQGGSILFLLDGTTVDAANLFATTNDNSLSTFVNNFGLQLKQDIVYDQASNETVNFGGGASNFIIRYPFWVKSLVADPTHPITSGVGNVVLPWPSSLEIDQEQVTARNLEVTTLLTTTEFAANQIGVYELQPGQQLAPTELEQKILAVSLIGQELESGKVPRIVAVTDSDFLSNEFVANSPSNLAFASQTIGWLSQEQSLAEIQLKQIKQRNLVFNDKSQSALVKYGNLSLVFFAPLVLGGLRLLQRRNLRSIGYQSDE